MKKENKVWIAISRKIAGEEYHENDINSDKNNQRILHYLSSIVCKTKEPSKEYSTERSWEKLQARINNYTTYNNNSFKKIKIFKYWSIAATIALLVLMGNITYNLITKSESEIIVVNVPAGNTRKVTLPDNTLVWINSDSRLVYNKPFTKRAREVYLSGEAYFDVTKNERKHFVVKTDDVNIRVVGTEFNVKSYPGENLLEATLVKGIVNIEYMKESPKAENIQLTMGQRAIVNRTNGNIDLQDNVEVINYISWKNGELRFIQSDMEDIIKQLERKFDIEIIIKTNQLKEKKYTGKFENDESLVQIFEVINISTPINYYIDNGRWIIEDK